MRPLSFSMPAAGLIALLATSGCSGGGTCTADASAALSTEGGVEGGAKAEGADATANPDGQGAVEDGGTTGDAIGPVGPTPTLAGLRLANWSTDSPPVDFCLAPHGTTAFQGPLLAAQAAASDAGSCDAGGPGLAFPEVSSYLLLAAHQYDARLVVGGATDCSVKLTTDSTNLPALAAGTFTTLALVGEAIPAGGAPGLQTIPFLDTGEASDAGVALRFINAAANEPAVELAEVLSGNSLAPIFVGVQFGQAGTIDGEQGDAAAPTSDTFVSFPASSPKTLDVSTSPGSSGLVASAPNFAAAAGAVVTLALVGPTTSADGGLGAELLECVDNAGTVCVTGVCWVVSQ